ncbi:MAG: polysaccharide biosynthesis tyrosine autokinase [Nitrospirae bacterium]|nr:polysaccharide biosynthesis tyrosine autokinase [Nitrospirota bacterium]
MELLRFLEVLRRRKKVIILSVALTFITVVVITLLITPWYDATAKILLRKPPANYFLNSAIGVTGEQFQSATSSTDRADYLAIAALRPNAGQVIEKLNLKWERVRYRIMKAIPLSKPILKAFGVDVNLTKRTITAERLLESSIMAKLFPRPNIKVEQYEDTDVYNVVASSSDPDEAKNMANTMAAAIVETEIKRLRSNYGEVRAFIDANINNIRQNYVKSLQAVKDFQIKENAPSLDNQAQYLIEQMQKMKSNKYNNDLAISKTKSAIFLLEAKIKKMSERAHDITSIGQNDILTAYKKQFATLYLNLSEAKSKYTPNHPVIQDYENQISRAKELMQKEYEKMMSPDLLGIDTVYNENRKKLLEYYIELSTYEAQNSIYPTVIKKYEDELNALPNKYFMKNFLDQDTTATKTVYSNFLTHSYRVELAENIALSNITVIEEAIVHEGSKHRHPNLPLNAVVALVMGLLIGVIGAFFMEYIDGTIKCPDDIKSLINLPVLGVIAKSDAAANAGYSGPVHPHISASFRTIGNSLNLFLGKHAPRTFAISSATTGEGKTFTIANLAATLALSGKKTLAIDGNLASPSLHSWFRLSQTPGLTDMSPDKPLSGLIRETSTPGLLVIAAGNTPEPASNILSSSEFKQQLRELSTQFDFILIDTPPVLSSDDAILIGSAAGAMILVAECGAVTHEALKDAISNITMTGTTLSGVILNKAASEKFREGSYRHFPPRHNGL